MATLLRVEEAEDALPEPDDEPASPAALRVCVPVLPRISNHTDFDPLRLHPQVALRFVDLADGLPPCDLLILPGSKSVRADLEHLRAAGWESAIRRHLRYGGRLLGICGGFQMLGQTLADPLGIEGPPGESPGLGLLELYTRLAPDKQLRNVRGRLAFAPEAVVSGYEIHAGQSTGAAQGRPALHLEAGPDGAVSDDGQVMGSYVHGLFETAPACAALLAWAGFADAEPDDYRARREAELDRLADAVEGHLDTQRLLALLAPERA